MSESTFEPPGFTPGTQSDLQSALFLEMAGQVANLALIFLGRVPHPETGKQVKDLESARTFIDQLEMLEVKTKGNLSRREEVFLRQSLMATRMAFVEVMEEQARAAQQPTPPDDPGARGAGGSPASTDTGNPPGSASGESPADQGAESDPRKKFVKRY